MVAESLVIRLSRLLKKPLQEWLNVARRITRHKIATDPLKWSRDVNRPRNGGTERGYSVEMAPQAMAS